MNGKCSKGVNDFREISVYKAYGKTAMDPRVIDIRYNFLDSFKRVRNKAIDVRIGNVLRSKI